VGTSGDIDFPGPHRPPQEFRKNLLRIRQEVGRNLVASVTTTDPEQLFPAVEATFGCASIVTQGLH
jgi:hypothetical protein